MRKHRIRQARSEIRRRQILQAALEACERYYQAFQFVIWAGKSAERALAGTMFETEGCA